MEDNDLLFGLEITKTFESIDRYKADWGKFKVNDRVTYIGKMFAEYTGKEFIITGANDCDPDGFEYSLQNFPYLVWENEIELVLRICDYCASPTPKENNCRKCGAPPEIEGA